MHYFSDVSVNESKRVRMIYRVTLKIFNHQPRNYSCDPSGKSHDRLRPRRTTYGAALATYL